ncbi:EamA family transporter RarD [Jatrophihabitans sp.]|uniref:EamA family transporter RarD n=1 Tax=Jatrophihabitans sp. TaxID=1932789 RepID=UPI002CC1B397|nr:EamA family transporter RarD [Jatrophihabitans sp.]
MPDHRKGLLYGFGAYLLWGLFPLYWPLLKPAGAVEILAQRMVWSLLLIAVVLVLTRGLGSVRRLVTDRGKAVRLALAAVVVSVNWGIYIWGVNSGQVVETSLGYFINPLLTILLGVLVLKERLTRPQWTAVGIATLAILVLTVDYGRLPWIALSLATSFGCYGFLKKQVSAGAVESLAIETAVLVGPALLTLVVLAEQSRLTFGHAGIGNALLLAGTGVVTAVPLLLFGAAASRLPLTSIGLLQYLAPTLQFLVGVGLRHEPMPLARLLGFVLVWVALVVLTVDALTRRRAAALADSAEAVAA